MSAVLAAPRAAVSALAALALAASATGCARDVGNLSIVLLRQTLVPGQDPFAPLEDANAVATIEVRIEAEDIGQLKYTVDYASGETSRLGAIPAGPGRIITVDGFSADERPVFHGRTLPLAVEAGNNFVQIFVARVNEFTATMDSLAGPRFGHTATVLPDGTVLLAGGATERVSLPSDPPPPLVPISTGGEIFHPTSASFVRPVPMAARAFHAAAPYAGGVLLSGGIGNAALVEVIDPETGSSSIPPRSDCVAPRAFHAAASLRSGAVLIAGGIDPEGSVLEDAEVLGGDTNCEMDSMVNGRAGLQLTTLDDGSDRILVTGGLGNGEVPVGDAEIYDPATNTFAAMGSLNVPRAFHTATALAGGYVLVIGGLATAAAPGTLVPTASIEIFDPTAGEFALLGIETAVPRWRHTATLLEDGDHVLIAGGWSSFMMPVPVPPSELAVLTFFGATAQDFGIGVILGPNLTDPRAGHTATLLGNGMVLLAGGAGLNGEVTNDAEIYNPF